MNIAEFVQSIVKGKTYKPDFDTKKVSYKFFRSYIYRKTPVRFSFDKLVSKHDLVHFITGNASQIEFFEKDKLAAVVYVFKNLLDVNDDCKNVRVAFYMPNGDEFYFSDKMKLIASYKYEDASWGD